MVGMTKGKKLLIFSTVVILLIAIYFTFFFHYSCTTTECFEAHQEKCVRTTYIRDSADATWYYKIKGKSGDACEIYVEVKKIKKGTVDQKRLEGKNMICSLPIGSTSVPESDVTFCKGDLKEELQTLIIKKLHSYILLNIGKINKELNVLAGTSITAGNSNETVLQEMENGTQIIISNATSVAPNATLNQTI